MNERFALVRKALNLTTRKFGEKINITGGAVTNMEKGKRNITDRVISDVCREFHVNEAWLRNGEGLMFKEEDTFSLDDYLNQKNCNEKDIVLIKAFTNAYMQFPEELRDSFIDNIINEFKTINQLSDNKVHDVDFIEESKED